MALLIPTAYIQKQLAFFFSVWLANKTKREELSYTQTHIHTQYHYVGLARTAPPKNTNFQLTFLLTRLH